MYFFVFIKLSHKMLILGEHGGWVYRDFSVLSLQHFYKYKIISKYEINI